MTATDAPTATDREWRFQPELTYQIPPTWADNGRHEVSDDDEERHYAVQIKLGISLHYGVNAAGEIVDGPHRDKPTVRVCYVSRDGRSAIVRDWDAVIKDGRAIPESEFASILAVDPADSDPVEDDENRSWYREVLNERYDVRPIIADGGQSTGETERCPGCGAVADEMSRDRGYSCPNRDCGVVAFGTGEMPL